MVLFRFFVKMPKQCNASIIAVSCLIGILLSVYALQVELHAEHDDKYKAMCDISEHISCTKVFMSEYGRGFGIVAPLLGEDSPLNFPNSIHGIVFYALIAILGLYKNIKAARVQVILSGLSNLLSIYLAYLLYFVLQDFCVVCVSCYAVNLVNLIFSLRRYRELMARANVDDKKKL